MLKKITIENYKCYQKSTLTLKDITVVVGNNNSGKSTLIEALRLVAYAASKYQNMNYTELPTYWNLPKAQKGFRINTSNLMIDLRGALHQYEGTLAKIDVEFDSLEHIIIYLNSDVAFACIQDADKNFVSTKGKARLLNISPVKIMPQLSLIKDEEKVISRDSIEKGLGTRLSSRHFRNELLLYKKESFSAFVKLAQNTWDGLRIQNIEPVFGDEPISLYVYDGNFCSEIGNMGSGLQMWLQIIWFLSRCNNGDTIILDEPDVYMHPDMQKKVFEIVSNKFKQVIVATHSVEIITEVDPHNIATIDRVTRRFSYANDMIGAQNIIDNIGGAHNLSLIRLGYAKKCVFVEGKDISLLSKIHKKLFPNSNTNISNIPVVSLGGKGKFEEALGTSKLFYDETKGQIKTICLLDRDYSVENEIQKYEQKASDNHLILHIWRKKEIENYLITPEIVFSASKLQETDKEVLYQELELMVEQFKESVLDQYSQKFYELGRSLGLGPSSSNVQARDYLSKKWTTLEEKMGIINGKDLTKAIIKMLREKFGISLRKTDFIAAINTKNISQEIIDVLDLLKS